jgi:hypothetical protein
MSSRWIGLLSAAFAISAGLHASVISEYNTGGLGSTGSGLKLGQSLTTPIGGPWNNIRFNFVNCGFNPTIPGACGSTDTPFAFGTLFLLTQEFTGLIPDSLTPGFVASTSMIVGGTWRFDTSVLLFPQTKYWFYMPDNDLSFTTRLRIGDDGVQGDGYFGLVGVTGWDKFRDLNQNFTGADTYFTLQGDASPVPEPSQSVLLAVSLSFCIWSSKRNRAATRKHR